MIKPVMVIPSLDKAEVREQHLTTAESPASMQIMKIKTL